MGCFWGKALPGAWNSTHLIYLTVGFRAIFLNIMLKNHGFNHHVLQRISEKFRSNPYSSVWWRILRVFEVDIVVSFITGVYVDRSLAPVGSQKTGQLVVFGTKNSF